MSSWEPSFCSMNLDWLAGKNPEALDPRWICGQKRYPIHFAGEAASRCLGAAAPKGFNLRQAVKALGKEPFRVISMCQRCYFYHAV